MANIPFLVLAVATSLGFQAGAATAWTCIFLDALVAPFEEGKLTKQGLLRHRSLVLSEQFLVRQAGDIVVFGQFVRVSEAPFLHQEQLPSIFELLSGSLGDLQTPTRIEYTYLSAYRFEGHQILNGELVPFESQSIDLRVTISDAYGGLVDSLPPMEGVVLGVLQGQPAGKGFEITSSPCPTYLPVEPDQLADLLMCFKDGECK